MSLALENTEGAPLSVAVGGETVALSIVVEAIDAVADPIVGFLVEDRLGQNLFGDNDVSDHPVVRGCRVAPTARTRGSSSTCRCFPPGDYSINAAIAEGTQHDHVQHEWMHDALLFRVETEQHPASLVGIPMRRGRDAAALIRRHAMPQSPRIHRRTFCARHCRRDCPRALA